LKSRVLFASTSFEAGACANTGNRCRRERLTGADLFSAVPHSNSGFARQVGLHPAARPLECAGLTTIRPGPGAAGADRARGLPRIRTTSSSARIQDV
jgi:hypothetical protein